MTQTSSAAGGVVLEPAEFYYLMRMNAATRVIGLEDMGVMPPPGAAGDAQLQEGFGKLQFHGWLRPVQRGRFDLNPELALLAAVVADPQYVVVAARNLTVSEVAVANHYLGADLIVELTLTAERHIRLAFEPDRVTLLKRVEELLAPTPNALPPARYSLPEPDFEVIRAAARGGQVTAAAERLGAAGFSAAHARSLAEALQTPQGDGRVAVVRVGAGEILGGRKAATHDGAAGGWLSRREDSTTLALSVETVQAGTVSGVVESYLQSLWVLLEPVA
jgi:hypothetical protein